MLSAQWFALMASVLSPVGEQPRVSVQKEVGIEQTINAEGGISGINLACTRMRQKK